MSIPRRRFTRICYNPAIMTRTAVALLVSIAMLAGCFPHNERHRTYAKWAEGGALVSGIVISSLAQTGADCDKMEMAGVESNCRTKAKILGGIGMALILGGLVGF